MSVMSHLVKSQRTEVTDKLRREVNKVVKSYVDQGVAEVVPGVVFIDEVHMLDIECFTYLNLLLESPMAPTVVLATNRGASLVRGTEDVVSPHGIPVDLLDRCLIVKTEGYTKEEVAAVVQLRAQVEGLTLGPGVLEKVAGEGERASLRYAIQLLGPASLVAQLSGRSEVTTEDIGEMNELFLDAKTSASVMGEFEGLLVNVKNAAAIRSRIIAASTAGGEAGEIEREAVNFAFIDARTITSREHLLAALYVALVAASHSDLTTKTVHSEILWALNYSNNITESIKRFGVSDSTTSLLVVRVGDRQTLPSGSKTLSNDEVKSMASSVVEGQWASLGQLSEITDWSVVRKYYKLNSDLAVTRFPKTKDSSSDPTPPKLRSIMNEIVVSAVAMKSVLA
ncbi:RuvB ATP-dependent DNA helicase pontin [Tulasnella sp. 427]|nr:RuvB ATP-dependent DNA helicase pontin [Tulasnella sp. 427]